ncbi:MAG: class I SAM-dependent rRNA methyltransferase [Acidobacteria bacterium]|nr:class I SAM-dependent rRNA methyltransferase [Acidobacteriota bacterium]
MEKIFANSLPEIKFRKNGDRRFKKGHPWVFSNELEEIPKYDKGSLVSLLYPNEKLAAIGFFNPHSLIAFREITRSEQIKANFLEERIKKSIDFRNKLYPKDEAKRIVFGESDHLPGLIIDYYGTVVVVQILTAGMEKLKEKIVEAINDIFNPEKIVLKNDSPSRALENIDIEFAVVKGSDSIVQKNFMENIFKFDLAKAQKTGLFLDQRENLSFLSQFDFKGKKALDLFCYFGSWGLRALKLGAERAIFVDSSKYAVEVAAETAKSNGFGNFATEEENVFDYLSTTAAKGEKFDFVFSDPPAFAKSARHMKEAYRAYIRLNEKCLRILNKGGILVASSCSYHIPYELFLESLMESASISKRNARLLFAGRQSLDHPILLNFPESNYLKTFFIQIEE